MIGHWQVGHKTDGQRVLEGIGCWKIATLDLLKFEAFPALAVAVQATVESVLERWQQVVCEKLPTADELTLVQLRDALPQMLRELAITMATEDGAHFESRERSLKGTWAASLSSEL